MTLKISASASFDIELAIKYGHTQALLINHFAFWIRVNQRKGKNFIDGRTWMYQTLEEIAENFPYLTIDQIRTVLDYLCTGKNRHSKGDKQFEPVLIKGNYNKFAFDKTTWYAFRDESFLNSNNSYETVDAPSTRKMTRPIPKAIKTKANKASSKEEANNKRIENKSPDSLLSDRKKIIAFLIQFAKERELFITERDVGVWLTKYPVQRIKNNLELAKRRKWNNLAKFMEKALLVDYAKEEENTKANREFLERFCKENDLTAKITNSYATFPGGYDLQFRHHPNQFNEILLNYYRKGTL